MEEWEYNQEILNPNKTNTKSCLMFETLVSNGSDGSVPPALITTTKISSQSVSFHSMYLSDLQTSDGSGIYILGAP